MHWSIYDMCISVLATTKWSGQLSAAIGYISYLRTKMNGKCFTILQATVAISVKALVFINIVPSVQKVVGSTPTLTGSIHLDLIIGL